MTALENISLARNMVAAIRMGMVYLVMWCTLLQESTSLGKFDSN